MLAAKSKGRVDWLPYGADLEIFHPRQCQKCSGQGFGRWKELCVSCHGSGIEETGRDIPIGFIGLLYAKRKSFIDHLASIYSAPIPILSGNVVVQDIDGIHPLDSVRRLAMNYQRIMIFVNLPSLSQLLVTKVVETMACGCCLLTPALAGAAAANMKPFEHGKHLLYYKEDAKQLNTTLGNLLREPEICQDIGRTGEKEVREKHSLRLRLEELLRVVGARTSAVTPVGQEVSAR